MLGKNTSQQVLHKLVESMQLGCKLSSKQILRYSENDGLFTLIIRLVSAFVINEIVLEVFYKSFDYWSQTL